MPRLSAADAARPLVLSRALVGVACALLLSPALAASAVAQRPVAAGRTPAASDSIAVVAAAAAVARESAPGALTARRPVTVRTAPTGSTVGTIAPGAVVTPLARERGWVRVRLEGWVPEREVEALAENGAPVLSAADLRADPAGTDGRVVRWNIEFLALQTADPLRRGFAPDEPYVLARGPGAENALLYLAVPPSLLETVRGLPPLARLEVVARVREGRSEPSGVPILDLQRVTRQ